MTEKTASALALEFKKQGYSNRFLSPSQAEYLVRLARAEGKMTGEEGSEKAEWTFKTTKNRVHVSLVQESYARKAPYNGWKFNIIEEAL